MPTYSYQCEECGDVADIIQKMNDSTLKKSKCLNCNKQQKVRRIIKGGSGIIFKGSGFYLTDYTGYGKNLKEKSNKSKIEKIESNSKKEKNIKED